MLTSSTLYTVNQLRIRGQPRTLQSNLASKTRATAKTATDARNVAIATTGERTTAVNKNNTARKTAAAAASTDWLNRVDSNIDAGNRDNNY